MSLLLTLCHEDVPIAMCIESRLALDRSHRIDSNAIHAISPKTPAGLYSESRILP